MTEKFELKMSSSVNLEEEEKEEGEEEVTAVCVYVCAGEGEEETLGYKDEATREGVSSTYEVVQRQLLLGQS